MKRKSLLLLIPFAVGALAGCTPTNPSKPQCDSATVTLNKSSITLDKGETYQLVATISIEGCLVTWNTDNEAVATVDENGIVTAVAEGTANISANGSAFCEVKVTGEEPPLPVDPVHAGTEADPYDSADAACVALALEEGGVTSQSYYIKDTVKKLEEAFNPQYGNYSFNIGNNFICWRLKNGASKANFNEGDIEVGDEVVVYAAIQKFHQDAKDDKPARNLLETKEGYVVSVTKGGTPDPGEPAINLSAYSATIKVGQDTTVTATVLNSDQNVSWSVTSGSDKVSIIPNGKSASIHGVAAGSAVVRATLGSTGKYKDCNVTVKGDAPVIEGTVLDFEELDTTAGSKDKVTYSSAKGTGQNDPLYNSAYKELRLYAKNTITISASGMTKISFDYNGCYTDGEKDPCHKATGDLVSASTGSISGGVWTGTADSVTFTVSDSGQVHIHQIGVVHQEAEDRILNSISVSESEEHKVFEVGDTFIGASVTAHFDNAADADVTSKANFSGYDMSTAGTQTVNVSYTENNVTKTTSYTITVNVPAEKTEYNFTADSQTSYKDDDKSGATIEITGATGYEAERGVAWNKSEGSVKISGLKAGTIKKITLDVSHNKTTKPTVSVSVGGNAYGSPFTIEKENHVSAEFAGDITAGDVIVSISKTTDGSIWLKKVTIAYEAGEPPVVEPAVLQKIEVSNNHRTFDLGAEFVKETVTATYDKGDPVDVTSQAIFSSVDMNTSGEQTVNVSYTENGVTKETSYTITISSKPAPQIQSILIDANGMNKEYADGDTIDLTGVEVYAQYETGDPVRLDSDKYSLSCNPETASYASPSTTLTASLIDTKVTVEPATLDVDLTVTEKEVLQPVTLSVSGGTSASAVKINQIDAIKCGTGSVAGAMMMTLPKGTSKLVFHAVGWNGESVTIKASKGGTELDSFVLTADSGFSGGSTSFTLTETDMSKFTFTINFDSPLDAETQIEFEATAGKRFGIWDARVKIFQKAIDKIEITTWPYEVEQNSEIAVEDVKLKVTYKDTTIENDIVPESLDYDTKNLGETTLAANYRGFKSEAVNITVIEATEKAVELTALSFPDENSEKNKVSAYDKTWTAIDENDYEYEIVNFNNNSWNGGWTAIKTGNKNANSTGTITTDTIADEVTEIKLNISAITVGNVTSMKLYSSASGDFTDAVEEGSFKLATGVQSVVLSTPKTGCAYRIEVVCTKATSNGVVAIAGLSIMGFVLDK